MEDVNIVGNYKRAQELWNSICKVFFLAIISGKWIVQNET
mgnify:CR=1 FL=1